MNIFTRILRKSRSFQYVYQLGFGAPRWSSRDYEEFSEEGYRGNPYVYAAVNALVDACSVPPVLLYRVRETGAVEKALDRAYSSRERHRIATKEVAARSLIRKHAALLQRQTGAPAYMARRMAIKSMVEAGELQEIDAHPALDLLNRPNGYYQLSYADLVAATVTSLSLAGKVFVEPIAPQTGENRGVPRELYVHPPRAFELEKPRDGNPLPGFRMRGSDLRFVYDPDPIKTEMFYYRYYNPDNPVEGLSPLEAAARSLKLNNEARAYNLSYMQNGGVPPGILTGKFTAEQAAMIQEQYQDQVAGSRNAGKPMVFGGEDMNYHVLGIDAQKMLWGDVLRLTAREVALVFNVPDVLVDSERKTFSNYGEARTALYQDAALPLLDFIYNNWNASWLKRFGTDLILDYDTDQVPALQEDMSKMYERIQKADFLTINEKRGALGWEDIDGGDVILVPNTMMPLEVAVEPPEAEAA